MIIEELNKIAQSLSDSGKQELSAAVKSVVADFDASEWSSTLPKQPEVQPQAEPKLDDKQTLTGKLTAKELEKLTSLTQDSLLNFVHSSIEFEVFIGSNKNNERSVYIKPIFKNPSQIITLGDAKFFPELMQKLSK